MATRIVSLLLLDASSGGSPTTTSDTAGDLGSFTIDFNGGSWTSIAGGNGIDLDAAAGECEAAISGTVLDANFEQAFTVEWLGGWNSGDASAAVHVEGTGGYYGVVSGDFVRFYDNGDNFIAAANHGGLATGEYVFQIAWDTSELTVEDRIKFWIEGVPFACIDVAIPAQNTDLDFTGATNFRIGTNKNGSGSCFNVGLYSTVLTDQEASDNATALDADNDADPNGGAPAAPEAPAPQGTGLFSMGFGL
jgi:hypothetical protein